MLKRYSSTIGHLFRLTDAIIVGCAWLGAYWLRFAVPILQVNDLPPFKAYAALTPLIIILWYSTFSAFKLYRSQRILRRTHEAFLIIKAHGFALLLFVAMTYMVSEYKFSRGVILYFAVISCIALVTFRLFIRNLLREARRRGHNLRHVLAVGMGPGLEAVLWRLNRFPELGLKPFGVLVPEGVTEKEIQKTPVLGSISALRETIQQRRPDQILVALPRSHSQHLDHILSLMRDDPIDIQLVPDIQDFVTLGCEVEDFDGLPIVNLNETPLAGWGAVAKRITDFTLASLGLLFLLPFLAIVALAVKLTSKGPIFYAQQRMGVDGKIFKMWKFRTMKTGADKEGTGWTVKADPRRTPIGSLLRSTSIDELPQLWNVVRGDMALVGPRPEQPQFVQQFRTNIPLYMLRHKVKSGITGWAQINGWRGDTSLERRIECDLFYIRHWSYGLDIKILLLTLWRGFVNKNAY